MLRMNHQGSVGARIRSGRLRSSNLQQGPPPHPPSILQVNGPPAPPKLRPARSDLTGSRAPRHHWSAPALPRSEPRPFAIPPSLGARAHAIPTIDSSANDRRTVYLPSNTAHSVVPGLLDPRSNVHCATRAAQTNPASRDRVSRPRSLAHAGRLGVERARLPHNNHHRRRHRPRVPTP